MTHQTMVIYHNPQCSKSREALDLLRAAGHQPSVMEYLKNPLSTAQLTELQSLLGVAARDMLRHKEPILAELSVDLNDDASVLTAMAQHPRLLERPIVRWGDHKAIIARPPELLHDWFKTL